MYNHRVQINKLEVVGQVKSHDQKTSHDFFGGGFKYSSVIVWQLSPQIDGKIEWDVGMTSLLQQQLNSSVVDGDGQIQKFTGSFYQNGEFKS